MERKSKITFEKKLSAVKDYIEGRKSHRQLAREYNVAKSSVVKWVSLYKSMGNAGLITSTTNVSYSEELKYAAVQEYLQGTASKLDICRKYHIRSVTQLSNWILKYNSHEKLKYSGSGGRTIMTKGRITTFEERIEIVKYCIEHDKNCNETAEKYKVSYQQVRSWTVKYDEFGIDVLLDRRGKRKAEGKLTALERLMAQNKLLEARNKRLEMENEL
jgi:transposase